MYYVIVLSNNNRNDIHVNHYPCNR